LRARREIIPRSSVFREAQDATEVDQQTRTWSAVDESFGGKPDTHMKSQPIKWPVPSYVHDRFQNHHLRLVLRRIRPNLDRIGRFFFVFFRCTRFLVSSFIFPFLDFPILIESFIPFPIFNKFFFFIPIIIVTLYHVPQILISDFAVI
jgi:hypothetical protein